MRVLTLCAWHAVPHRLSISTLRHTRVVAHSDSNQIFVVAGFVSAATVTVACWNHFAVVQPSTIACITVGVDTAGSLQSGCCLFLSLFFYLPLARLPACAQRVCTPCKHTLELEDWRERVEWRLERVNAYLGESLIQYFDTGVVRKCVALTQFRSRRLLARRHSSRAVLVHSSYRYDSLCVFVF